MNIPFRTRRTLNRLGTAALILILVSSIAWLCWVVWLQQYVVYTDEGATLNFAQSANDVVGIAPKPAEPKGDVEIYYNEGADAVNIEHDLTQLNGYYITNEMVKTNYDETMLQIERLPSGTPVMIEMKGPFGTFFYQSNLNSAVASASTDMAAMAKMVDRLQSKGFYTIAQVSAFRDRTFGENNVNRGVGLFMLSRAGLWMDPGGMYWLDPTNATTTTWITSVVLELKDMGFDEVMLADFRFPDGDQYIFKGDKVAALQDAASKLVNSCASDNFCLSFCVDDPGFALPEGRTRLYLKDISAAQVGATAAKVQFEESDIRLVFLSETGDTRFDEYGVLRSMSVAEEVEARKG